MSEKKKTPWTSIRLQLKEWEKPALVALIKDLYDASPETRHFLEARFQAEQGGVPPWRNTASRSSNNSIRRAVLENSS